MKSPFLASAQFYDTFYSDKDYEGECDFVESVIAKFARQRVKRVLDVGCGTGGHSIILAHRGYVVTGIDKSAAMLALARRKAEGIPNVSFRRADVSRMSLSTKFDCAISMFAVVSYLHQERALLAAFDAVRRHLAHGSLFIFEFWYAPGVLNLKAAPRTKLVTKGELTIQRRSSSRLIRSKHLCLVDHRISVRDSSGIVKRIEERHTLRYFFPDEIKECLSNSGFRLRGLFSGFDLQKEPDENSWYATAVAEATLP